MKNIILLLVILLSLTPVLAKKVSQPEFVGTPFEIDEEFQTEFVGFDEKEFKTYKKEQKAIAKIHKKRAKLENKKIKLEKKRDINLKNYERNQAYIEQLKTSSDNKL